MKCPPYLVRISRVVGVDEAKLLAWAKERKKLAEAKKITSIAATVDADIFAKLLK